MKRTIKVIVCLEGVFWVALFERVDELGFSAARVVFGKEPTDPELYEYISANYRELKFTEPQNFKLIIKRKNPKRVLREVKREMEKAKNQSGHPKTSFAQDVLRAELEKNKKIAKSKTREEKDKEKQEQFLLKQEKKKKKLRGH